MRNHKAFGRYDNGFTITFENGLVLSTRFGAMNYCENKKSLGDFPNERDGSPLLSDDVEIGVWYENDERNNTMPDWVTDWQQDIFNDDSGTDDVRGWVTHSEWLRVVNWCRVWRPE